METIVTGVLLPNLLDTNWCSLGIVSPLGDSGKLVSISSQSSTFSLSFNIAPLMHWQASRRSEIAISLRWFVALSIGSAKDARARHQHNRDRARALQAQRAVR